jgi:DNA-binding XRE family transcriptional regulator
MTDEAKTFKTARELNGEVTPRSLKGWREHHRFTQEQVGEALGVHRVTVARWEAGERPNLEQAVKLARFYETTVEALFGHLLQEDASGKGG